MTAALLHSIPPAAHSCFTLSFASSLAVSTLAAYRAPLGGQHAHVEEDSMRILRLLATIAGVWLVAQGVTACTQPPASADAEQLTGTLVLTGSTTIAPLASEIGKRFEAEHPGVRVDVQGGGSARGIADVQQGLATIGMVSRALKDEEAQELVATTIASDGVGMIVHASNPVAELSTAQIIDIYLGKITNWREVGGNDAPITVVNKAEGRAALELFTQFFKIDNKDIKAQVVIGDNAQGVKTVAGNPNAIGYLSIGAAEYEAAQGTPIKLLPLNGVSATTANVQNGTYKLARPLNLVTKGEPQGLARAFIDWARSPAMYTVIEEQFLVPLGSS
jgi:phosphate transport system substrate-binding protein